MSSNRKNPPCHHSPLETPACLFPSPPRPQRCTTRVRSEASLPLCPTSSHQAEPLTAWLGPPNPAEACFPQEQTWSPQLPTEAFFCIHTPPPRLLGLSPAPSGPSLPSQPWSGTWLPRAESGGVGGGCGSISGLSGPSGLLCWSSVSSCPRLGQKSLVRGPQKSLPGTLPFFLCCGASHLLSLWPPTLLSSRASHHASNSLVPNQAQTSPPTPMSPPLP